MNRISSPGGDTAAAGDDRAAAVHELEREFGLLFAQMRRLYTQIADQFSPGMLPGTYKVFSLIAHHGPVTARDLGERLSIDKGQLSRNIRELEDLGFVARTPDPRDGRVSIITPTEAGLSRLEVARGPAGSRLGEVLGHWDVSDIRSLSTLLHALSAAHIGAVDTDAD